MCAAQLAHARAFGYCRFMFSVLIETHNHEEALARTLASLVGGAVEGAVRDVIVCDRGSTDHTRVVAEHAGCHYLAGDYARALASAKADWLMLLEPGARMGEGWIEAAVEHAASSSSPACFRRPVKGAAARLARLFSARKPLAGGVLITKHRARELANGGGAAELARAVSMKRLKARIVPAG